LLSQLWGALFGTLQGIALSQAENIELDTYLRYLRPFKPIIDGAAEDLVTRVAGSRLQGDEQTLAAISAHYAAFQHLLELTAEHKLNGTIAEAFDGIFRSAIAGGHMGDDFAALSKFMR
ncbi:NAD(P)-dependent oxidoreductase, partial [Rhizobiaceae sp. 2RAB30]